MGDNSVQIEIHLATRCIWYTIDHSPKIQMDIATQL